MTKCTVCLKNESIDDKILEIAAKRPVSLELLKFLFHDVDYRYLNLRVQQLRKYRLLQKKTSTVCSFYISTKTKTEAKV